MDEAIDCVSELLRRAGGNAPNFPPTLLFEEGWMLRLVLEWLSTSKAQGHALSFAKNSIWYSEGWLTSAFLARHRGDKYAEGFTHADGVIGNFDIGRGGQARLTLTPSTEQFIVVEAKMFSSLSKGTTRAPHYNQAARNVACMAELARRADCAPSRIQSLGFFVTAPKEQIDFGVFAGLVEKSSIEQVVGARVRDYDQPKTDWFENWFLPTLEAMRIDCIAWETIVDFTKVADPVFGADLESFYNRCLEFNRPRSSVG